MNGVLVAERRHFGPVGNPRNVTSVDGLDPNVHTIRVPVLETAQAGPLEQLDFVRIGWLHGCAVFREVGRA